MRKVCMLLLMSIVCSFAYSQIISTKDGGSTLSGTCYLVGTPGQMYSKSVCLAKIKDEYYMVLSFCQPKSYNWEKGAPLIFKMNDSSFITLQNSNDVSSTESNYVNEWIGTSLLEGYRSYVYYHLNDSVMNVLSNKNPVRFRVFNEKDNAVYIYERDLTWTDKPDRKTKVVKDFKWFFASAIQQVNDLSNKAKEKTIYDGM